MAYYSTVVIILNNNIKDKYNEILNDIENKYNIPKDNILINYKLDGICIYIDKCKWYEYTLEDKLLSTFKEEDYLFIRIGEEYPDHTILGNFWNNSFSPKLEVLVNINLNLD